MLQVKEARAVAATLSKQKSVVLRAARARGRPPPEHDGGLSRRLVCMEKLVEVRSPFSAEGELSLGCFL